MHPSFPRQLEPELLDMLPPRDERARRARSDLRRINRLMGSAGIIAQAMAQARRAPLRILELGAGDAWLMLQVARRFGRDWPGVRLTLLDRQEVVSEETLEAFHRLRWQAELQCEDAIEWAVRMRHDPRREPREEDCRGMKAGQDRHGAGAVRSAMPVAYDIVVANLFLHHFDSRQLTLLFEALSRRCDMFIGCEPRRARLPLFASKLVGLIGASRVTREDAVTSVRAGFRGGELSALWPKDGGWHLEEREAGLFSHLFVAMRGGAS